LGFSELNWLTSVSISSPSAPVRPVQNSNATSPAGGSTPVPPALPLGASLSPALPLGASLSPPVLALGALEAGVLAPPVLGAAVPPLLHAPRIRANAIVTTPRRAMPRCRRGTAGSTPVRSC
jgi:hypothetical protein